jgi:hypothetical protein
MTLGRMLEGTKITNLADWFWLLMFCPFLRSINFGGPRIIPKQHQIGVKVHRSVKIRMEAPELFKDKKYMPAAKLDIEPVWIA